MRNPNHTVEKSLNRRVGLLVAGLGLGAGLVLWLLRVSAGTAQETAPGYRPLREHTVDDRGTDQAAAAKMILKLRDRTFDGSDERLSLALGRPLSEVTAWQTGAEVIDDDVVMKVRSIAWLRGIEIE